MRRVLAILVVCIILVGLAWFLAGLPGTVTAQIGDTTIEAGVPAVALGLLLLVAVVHLLLRLLGAIIGLPAALRRYRARRNRRLGDIAVTRALVALAAGESADARREAQRARHLLGDTAQTLLLSAEAGHQAQREDEAEAAFHALSERSDAAFLGLRGLLRQAVARQDWTEAALLARRAEAAHPGAAWLRAERWQLAIRTQDWKEALALSAPDGPRAALAAAAAAAEPAQDRALKLARDAHESDPGLPAAALAYARRLREAGKEKRAQAVIRRAWQSNPHPDLAEFALASETDLLTRYKAAQLLAETNPGHVESEMLLARTALDAELLGEARRHAEAATQSGQRRAWVLLADIAEAQGPDNEAARQAQRDALRHAATAGPDPIWRCEHCGSPQQAWAPVCPHCFTPGRIAWTDRQSAALLPGLTA
jgi:HemY protein